MKTPLRIRQQLIVRRRCALCIDRLRQRNGFRTVSRDFDRRTDLDIIGQTRGRGFLCVKTEFKHIAGNAAFGIFMFGRRSRDNRIRRIFVNRPAC